MRLVVVAVLDDAIAKRYAFMSLELASIESFAYGLDVPIPILPALVMMNCVCVVEPT